MQVGYHVSRKEVKNAVDAISMSCDAIKTYGFIPSLQIFVTNPQSGATLFNDNELESIKSTVASNNASLYVHGAYIDVPWKKSEKACFNIVKEMTMSKKCGAVGVIIHLSKDAYGEALTWVLNKINEKILDDSVILFLEVNAAKSSKYTFETPEKIHALINQVTKLKLNYRVGLCIDTAHLFSCGTDLSYTKDADVFFDNLMSGMPDIPIILHLNDSASTLGSGKDKHDLLCKGNIWKATDDDCGLLSVLTWTQLYDIPIILERSSNGDATNDLTIIQLWRDHSKLM